MRDDELVAAIVAGDPVGFAAAYDRYAAPLYSYCLTLFREPEDAAGAVQDTFVIAASRLSGLWNAARLRPWLYAVARNEYLRRPHGRQAPAGPVARAADTQNWQAALVRDALQGTGPADRDVLKLRLHNLDANEQALVLGISASRLAALVSRAADQLPACLSVLLVARTGRGDCQQLDAMLHGWDGELTPRLRRRLTGHLEHCATCTVRGHRELPPSIVGGAALAAVPPPWLRQQVLDAVTAADEAAVLHRGAMAKRAGPFGDTGFPRRRTPQPRRHRRVVGVSAAGTAVTAAAAAAVVFAGGGLHVILPLGTSAAVAVSASVPVRAAASPAKTGRGGTGPATAARGADKALATTPAPSPSPSPSPQQAATEAAQGTVSVSPSTLTLTPQGSSEFTITAHGGPVQWSVEGPASLVAAVRASQPAGTLAAGHSVTVTLTEVSSLTANSELMISPGGKIITIIAGT